MWISLLQLSQNGLMKKTIVATMKAKNPIFEKVITVVLVAIRFQSH